MLYIEFILKVKKRVGGVVGVHTPRPQGPGWKAGLVTGVSKLLSLKTQSGVLPIDLAPPAHHGACGGVVLPCVKNKTWLVCGAPHTPPSRLVLNSPHYSETFPTV